LGAKDGVKGAAINSLISSQKGIKLDMNTWMDEGGKEAISMQ
jgi:hypothetical protein